MKSFFVGALALLLVGCATVNYLKQEYGAADRDGTVTLPSGDTFWIWQHKAKSKIIISVDVNQAISAGFQRGLLGAQAAVPQPVFEEVGRQWFVQSGRPECHQVRGYPIDITYFEIEYACGPAQVAGMPAPAR